MRDNETLYPSDEVRARGEWFRPIPGAAPKLRDISIGPKSNLREQPLRLRRFHALLQSQPAGREFWAIETAATLGLFEMAGRGPSQ